MLGIWQSAEWGPWPKDQRVALSNGPLDKAISGKAPNVYFPDGTAVLSLEVQLSIKTPGIWEALCGLMVTEEKTGATYPLTIFHAQGSDLPLHGGTLPPGEVLAGAPWHECHTVNVTGLALPPTTMAWFLVTGSGPGKGNLFGDAPVEMHALWRVPDGTKFVQGWAG